MRFWIVVAAAPLTSACTPPEVAACEDRVKAELNAPSSYKRESASSRGGVVDITYTNEGIYGATVAGHSKCRFSKAGSNVTITEYLPYAELPFITR